MNLRAMVVGWTLGCVVGVGVLWFNVNLWAAVPVIFVCTMLATLATMKKN